MTAANSVSLSCFQAGIVPLFWPFSRIAICLLVSASSTTAAPSSGLNGPSPLPVGWWHTEQFAAYTFSPRATSSSSANFLFGSSASAAIFFFCPSTQAL